MFAAVRRCVLFPLAQVLKLGEHKIREEINPEVDVEAARFLLAREQPLPYPETRELVEYGKIGDSEPQNLYIQHLKKMSSMSSEEFRQSMEISQRAGMSKQICDWIRTKLGESSWYPEIQGMLEFHYDPQSVHAEFDNFVLQEKILRMKKQENEKFAVKFYYHFAAGGLILLLSKIAEIKFGPEFALPAVLWLFAWSSLFLGMQFMLYVQEFLLNMKVGLSEFVKVRLSLTTGDVAQLLMRIVAKIEFIEQRSCEWMCRQEIFKRFFKQDFLEVEWRSTHAGAHFGQQMITNFVAMKVRAGARDIGMADRGRFTAELQRMVAEQVDKSQRAGQQENAAMFQRFHEDLPEFVQRLCESGANEIAWSA